MSLILKIQLHSKTKYLLQTFTKEGRKIIKLTLAVLALLINIYKVDQDLH